MASLSSNAVGTALVLHDGEVYIWGQLDAWTAEADNIPSVLGETPVRVERLRGPLGNEIAADAVKALSAEIGNFHAAILSEAGDLYTWGSGGGHLGLGHADDVRVPTLVGALHGQRVVQVSLGNHMTVALVGTGHVYTFGVSTCGQLGTGERSANIAVPARLNFPADAGKIVFVSAGGVHALATSEHGKLYSWGK
jgi:alpha-tubulin suppressor-like RCC1 family protein